MSNKNYSLSLGYEISDQPLPVLLAFPVVLQSCTILTSFSHSSSKKKSIKIMVNEKGGRQDNTLRPQTESLKN